MERRLWESKNDKSAREKRSFIHLAPNFPLHPVNICDHAGVEAGRIFKPTKLAKRGDSDYVVHAVRVGQDGLQCPATIALARVLLALLLARAKLRLDHSLVHLFVVRVHSLAKLLVDVAELHLHQVLTGLGVLVAQFSEANGDGFVPLEVGFSVQTGRSDFVVEFYGLGQLDEGNVVVLGLGAIFGVRNGFSDVHLLLGWSVCSKGVNSYSDLFGIASIKESVDNGFHLKF
jgi:hypothetical protein